MDSLCDQILSESPMFKSTPKKLDSESDLTSEFVVSPRWNNSHEFDINFNDEELFGQVDQSGFVTFKLRKGVLVDVKPDCSAVRLVNQSKDIAISAAFTQWDVQPLQVSLKVNYTKFSSILIFMSYSNF